MPDLSTVVKMSFPTLKLVSEKEGLLRCLMSKPVLCFSFTESFTEEDTSEKLHYFESWKLVEQKLTWNSLNTIGLHYI